MIKCRASIQHREIIFFGQSLIQPILIHQETNRF